MSYTLFPKGESWLTGDEASDIKLTQELKRVYSDLNEDNIRQFSNLAEKVRPRLNQSSYNHVINSVIIALIELNNPQLCINQEFTKFLGHFHKKFAVKIDDHDIEAFFTELTLKKRLRYRGEVEFSLEENSDYEFNPYLEYRLKKSKYSLKIRSIFKDFKDKLNNKNFKESDKILFLLQEDNNAYIVKDRYIFWSHENEFFGLVLDI